MIIITEVLDSPVLHGQKAARCCSEILSEAIAEQGYALIILSTGASQFDTLASLISKGVDWSKVEMFHLDEYMGMPKDLPVLEDS